MKEDPSTPSEGPVRGARGGDAFILGVFVTTAILVVISAATSVWLTGAPDRACRSADNQERIDACEASMLVEEIVDAALHERRVDLLAWSAEDGTDYRILQPGYLNMLVARPDDAAQHQSILIGRERRWNGRHSISIPGPSEARGHVIGDLKTHVTRVRAPSGPNRADTPVAN
jgi:hypothetical protein